jgi:hypothetical protein
VQRGISFGRDYDPSFPSFNNKHKSEEERQSSPGFGYEYKANSKQSEKYDSYKFDYGNDYQEPNFGSRNNSDHYNLDKDYENAKSSKNIDSKYSKDSYRSNHHNEKEYKPFDDNYGTIQEEERFKFSEKSSEDSKYETYKVIGAGQFETLGGVPYEKPRAYEEEGYRREPEPNSFGQYPSSLNKLASSQVDEYKSTEEMEKKLQDTKYRKLGIDRSSYGAREPKSSTKVRFDEEDEDE